MMIAGLTRMVPLLLAVVPAGLPGMAQAQFLAAEVAEIRRLIDAGQAQEAAAAARDFARLVTDEVGFGVTNAQLTATPASGYGVFEPRDDAVYAVNESVYAYVELFGFSLIPQPDGANALVFDVAFTLDTPEGRQITDAMVPMGEIRLTSHSEPLDAYFHLTYSITGAEGVFNLRTQVTDRASGETAEFVLPLEFEPQTPSDPADGNGDKRP